MDFNPKFSLARLLRAKSHKLSKISLHFWSFQTILFFLWKISDFFSNIFKIFQNFRNFGEFFKKRRNFRIWSEGGDLIVRGGSNCWNSPDGAELSPKNSPRTTSLKFNSLRRQTKNATHGISFVITTESGPVYFRKSELVQTSFKL